MSTLDMLKLKDRDRIIKEHNFKTRSEVDAYRKAIDDYTIKQLILTETK